MSDRERLRERSSFGGELVDVRSIRRSNNVLVGVVLFQHNNHVRRPRQSLRRLRRGQGRRCQNNKKYQTGASPETQVTLAEKHDSAYPVFAPFSLRPGLSAITV